MPPPMMDLKGFPSSSHLGEDPSFLTERQVGFWKSETLPAKNGSTGGNLALSNHSSSKLISGGSPVITSLHHPQAFMVQEQKLNFPSVISNKLDKEENGTLAPLKPMGLDQGSNCNFNLLQATHFTKGNNVEMMGTYSENSLFSSSLSELFSRKMKITSNNGFHGQSINTVASHYEEEEPPESMDDIEAHMIGDLLPDDDELLSGMTDGLEFVLPSKGTNEIDELDFFNSVGGMDLEEDCSSDKQKRFEYPGGGNGSTNGERPFGECPSRTLFVRNINSNIEDSELQSIFEQYGDIHTLYTACKHRGFVMISYFDIRAARTAMKALQNKSLRRRKIDIHYSIPKDNLSAKDNNQGTLAVFNVNSSVSDEQLRHIFGAYGEINYIYEMPQKNNDRFIEFYDIRAAQAALHELDGSTISGKQIQLRPIGVNCLAENNNLELEQEEFNLFLQKMGPTSNLNAGLSRGPSPSAPNKHSVTEDGVSLGFYTSRHPPFHESAFHYGISSSVPNSLPSLMKVGSTGSQSGLAKSGHLIGHLKFDTEPAQNAQPHSLPDYHDPLGSGIHGLSPSIIVPSLNSQSMERSNDRPLLRVGSNGHTSELNEDAFGSVGKRSCLVPGQYPWSCNPYQPQSSSSMMWPNSPSYVNSIHAARISPRLSGMSVAASQMLNPVLPIRPHHVGSAPSVNHSMWDHLQPFSGESPETSSFHHPVSLGSMRVSNNSLHSMDFVPQNMFSQLRGNSLDFPVDTKNVRFQFPLQRSMFFPGRGQVVALPGSYDASNERIRSRRSEGSSTPVDNKKQYELDIDRIIRGEDNRTTLMIKNIPNKYTSKMLLATIDERHRGTYDFIYLPIDFKNKCNVGYAFINMTDPSQIIPFYKAFNGKKWEKFNSEKVASIAYARIQGKAALIAHFQNSSLMNEDKRCRPILFNTEGPNAGDQVPFPMGVNVRTRPGKSRTSTAEDNSQGTKSSSHNWEDPSNRDKSISCDRDSD